jgi:hypothetical protein
VDLFIVHTIVHVDVAYTCTGYGATLHHHCRDIILLRVAIFLPLGVKAASGGDLNDPDLYRVMSVPVRVPVPTVSSLSRG